MNQQYDDTNRGALFKNDKKESDRHPDYKGTLNVNGAEFWVSSWLKVSKNGEKYMSLSVSPKENAPKQAPRAKVTVAQDDDDLPF